MKYLGKTIERYWALMLLYLGMGITGAFLQSFQSRYFQRIIDGFTNNSLSLSSILIYGTAMLLVYLISYLDEYPGRKLEHGIELGLKTDALRKISAIDYLSYVNLGTGMLIQRIENGAAAGKNILFEFYLRIASTLLPEMLFSIFFIFMINRAVTIAILAGYLIVFVITHFLLKSLYKIKTGILVNEEKLNHFLVRGFMEMVVFRINRRFPYEIQKAEIASNEITSSKVKMTLIHEAFFTIFAILVGFVKIGMILYGWTTKQLTIGEIVALISLVDKAYVPIAIFNVLYVQYKLDIMAFKRYTDFLDTKEDTHLNQGTEVSELKGDIRFTDVEFCYQGREIFKGLNLHIQSGMKIAFVGESGSGKSTAVKLLAGLLHPLSGKILVDDRDLNQINLNSYYQYIAYLPQEPPIFDGTLRENLIFDTASVKTDSALLEAMQKVGLDELYSKLEHGLDTHLGEKGVHLSGGERQLLALSRLWFSHAELIIFDEATSAIDNLTEQAVMKNVMELLAGKTVIAIAHRLDSIKDFDDIIVFQDGMIVERGKFQDLIGKQLYFYQLYSRTGNIG